jgi:hypothetical protein
VIDALPASPEAPRRAPIAATLGVLSVALLGASVVRAHHWGLVSIAALVVAGAVRAAGINPTGVCGGG